MIDVGKSSLLEIKAKQENEVDDAEHKFFKENKQSSESFVSIKKLFYQPVSTPTAFVFLFDFYGGKCFLRSLVHVPIFPGSFLVS